MSKNTHSQKTSLDTVGKRLSAVVVGVGLMIVVLYLFLGGGLTRLFVAKELINKNVHWQIRGYGDGDPLSEGFELILSFNDGERAKLSLWSITFQDFSAAKELNFSGGEYQRKMVKTKLVPINGKVLSCSPNNVLNLSDPNVEKYLDVENINTVDAVIKSHRQILEKLSELPTYDANNPESKLGVLLPNYCDGIDVLLFSIM